jgi:hypothetical protein
MFKKVILSALFLSGMFSLYVRADQVVSGSGSGGYTQFGDTVGYVFNVGSTPLLVVQLGTGGYAGVTGTNFIVGLWNSSGTLLASGTNSVSGSYVGYNLPTPVTLLANTAYYAGSIGTSFNYQNASSGTAFGVSPYVTSIATARNGSSGVFSFPGSTNLLGQAIVGPFVAFQAITAPVISTSFGGTNAVIIGGTTNFTVSLTKIKSLDCSPLPNISQDSFCNILFIKMGITPA